MSSQNRACACKTQRPRLKVLCSVAALLLATVAPGHAALVAWEDPWVVTFNNTIPLGPKPAAFDGIDPIWYCGSDAAPPLFQSCEADQGPLRAAFRYQWTWSNIRPVAEGHINLRVDDHYALYVNGKLAGSNWLEDVGIDGYYSHRLDALLNRDGANEILIFACDGRKSDNAGFFPLPVLGADMRQGWQGCPNRLPLGNHYLLVNGRVDLYSNQFGAGTVSYSLHGGEPSGWKVSAVPEPGVWALLLAAIPGALASRAGRKAGNSR